jgi:hypothetical protein
LHSPAFALPAARFRLSKVAAISAVVFRFCIGFSAALAAVRVSATSVVPPDFAQLVNESDYVVRGVVKSVQSEFAAPTSRKIVTNIEVDVLEVIAGQPPEKVVLHMLGGRVGDQEMILEGAPEFRVGEESIFFVSGNGRTICPLFAMKYGQYPIAKEPETGRPYVARGNKAPLENVSEVALPMMEGPAADLQARLKNPARALSPADFVQQIKSAVNPNYRRAKAR